MSGGSALGPGKEFDTRSRDARALGRSGARRGRRRGAARRARGRAPGGEHRHVGGERALQTRVALAARDRLPRDRRRAERSRGEWRDAASAWSSRSRSRRRGCRTPWRSPKGSVSRSRERAHAHLRRRPDARLGAVARDHRARPRRRAAAARSRARPARRSIVTGRFGGPLVALRALERGANAVARAARARSRIPSRVCARRVGSSSTARRAAIDISDGLLGDAAHLARGERRAASCSSSIGAHRRRRHAS